MTEPGWSLSGTRKCGGNPTKSACNVLIVSGHHGMIKLDSNRIILDGCAGHHDRPLTAVVFPERQLVINNGSSDHSLDGCLTLLELARRHDERISYYILFHHLSFLREGETSYPSRSLPLSKQRARKSSRYDISGASSVGVGSSQNVSRRLKRFSGGELHQSHDALQRRA